MSEKRPPDPEEIQKEIEELMREKFGGNVHIVTQKLGAKSEVEDVESEVIPAESFDLNFDYNPKKIKEYLDGYIVKQDEAKKALAIAVCDHYNHVRACHERRHEEQDADDNYSKQNILMLGPTGVGKTYLVKMIAKLIGVPFVKADATRFTETGYVGANVDDMVRDLVSMANDNIELAQYGIIYFDEADKLAGHSNVVGKDISGRGVQYGLLKLMEETEIDLTAAHDMISQLRSFMDFQRKGKVVKKVINTKHILFIVSGAFSGLEELIEKRLKLRKIGLTESDDDKQKRDDLFQHATTKDFVDFGFEPEFIGRLPIRVSCQSLLEDDLYKILKNSKGSIIRQYEASFKAFGIDVYFEDDALMAIAELASQENTGARALMTVCERIFRDYKFELPSSPIKAFVVTAELVKSPAEYLGRILDDRYLSDLKVLEFLVKKEERGFSQQQQLAISIEREAVEEIFRQENCQIETAFIRVQDLMKNFLYGLKIIQQNSGKNQFILGREAICDPQKYLDEKIKESYH